MNASSDVGSLLMGVEELVQAKQAEEAERRDDAVNGPAPERTRGRRKAVAVEETPLPGSPSMPPEVDFGDGFDTPIQPTPMVAEPSAPPMGTSRTVPHKVRQLLQEQEYVRLMRVERGAEQYVGDYRVREVSAAGDIDAFIANYIVPELGGGEYRVYVPTKTNNWRLIHTARFPVAVQQHQAPGSFSAPGGNMDWMAGWIKAQAEADQAKANADAVRSKETRDGMLALFGLAGGGLKKDGEGVANGAGRSSMDAMMTMMMMRMLEPPPVQAQPAFGPMDMMLMQQQMAAQQQQQPPPMPPPLPPPTTDWAGVITAVGTLINGAVVPIADAIRDSRPKQESWLDRAPFLLAAAKEAGLLGQPRLTHSDVMAAEMRAKLDMIMNQPPDDPIEQFTKFAGLMAQLQPRTASPRDWFDVGEKLIDKLPEITREIREAVAGEGKVSVSMVQSSAGRKVPAALAEMRAAVLAADMTDPQAEVNIILIALNALQEIGQAGGMWARAVNDLLQGAMADDKVAVRKALNTLFGGAWAGNDPDAKAAFKRIWRAYDGLAGEVGRVLRQKAGVSQPTGRKVLDFGGADTPRIEEKPVREVKRAERHEAKREMTPVSAMTSVPAMQQVTEDLPPEIEEGEEGEDGELDELFADDADSGEASEGAVAADDVAADDGAAEVDDLFAE